MKERLGIYIHIPFCVSKCGYCDFYSVAGGRQRMADYQSALLSHISESAEVISNYEVDSVYIGGGTPSCYGAKRIVEILDELKRIGNLRLDAEITMEANPDTTRLDELKMLLNAGVNRISFGVQSANNDILKMIGRRHNFRQAQVAVETARAAGFENVSVDLIYGLPTQSKGDWADTLAKTLELQPEHFSCYALKLEEGTPMYRSYLGSPLMPDDDEQADVYLYAVDTLRSFGYEQYEISNFAIPGYASRHNFKYWTLADYIGFGPGAHSYAGGVRYSYVKDLDKYISAVMGDGMIIDEYEQTMPLQKATEYLMLGMRTVRGISEQEYHRIYRSDWAPIEETFELFRSKGWAEQNGRSWHLTPEGFLISNTLINAVLEAQTGAKVENNPWLRDLIAQDKKQELPEGEYERFIAQYADKMKK